MDKNKYIKNIPKEMKEKARWIFFKKIETLDKKGNKKTIKLPINPITNTSKGWNSKENWLDFDQALRFMEEQNYDGISFVLVEEDGYICIDLDNIGEDKKKHFIEMFKDSYIEISSSCKGLHIFCKGKIKKGFNNQLYGIEMYKGNKCIAMTADLIGTNILANKQKLIDELYESYATKESTLKEIERYKNLIIPYSLPSKDKIVELMCKYNTLARDLFYGTYTSGDASKDDFNFLLILNSFCHSNHALMKEIFLTSALNRMDDRTKRKSEIAYLKYLDISIDNAIKIGHKNYWDYNYHRKKEAVR